MINFKAIFLGQTGNPADLAKQHREQQIPQQPKGDQIMSNQGKTISRDSSRTSESSTEVPDQKKKKKKKEQEKYVMPQPIEQQFDEAAVKYALANGITNPALLKGKMSDHTCKVLSEAKLKHRTKFSLAQWSQDGYYKRQKDVLDPTLKVAQQAEQSGIERTGIKYPEFVDTIERVEYNDLSEKDFIEKFEFGSKPVIIKNVAKDWKGLTEWKMGRMLDRFGASRFKIGEDDDGNKIKVTLNQYMEYVLYGRDDSPLYLFQSSLEEHPEAHVMQKDYKQPKYFKHNLFSLLDEEDMPPHRWFLIGPKRSGSEVHQDPLGTSAWNTSVQGFKRWILFPPAPGLKQSFARGKHLEKKQEDNEAIHFYDFIYPRLKQLENHPQGRIPNIIECIQYPGETMFVPGAWWHAVLNLDTTIAITENVCNEGNFERVWMQARKDRKRLAYCWLKKIRKQYPDLFRVAVQMNIRDNFEMWYPPLSSSEKLALNSAPYAESSTTDVSSSTSSSSSSSEDDEMTIEVVHDGIDSKSGSEFFGQPEGQQLRFALLVRLLNKQIREKARKEKKAKKEAKEKAKEQFEDDQAGRRSRSQSNEEDSDAQFDGGSVETIRSKKQYD